MAPIVPDFFASESVTQERYPEFRLMPYTARQYLPWAWGIDPCMTELCFDYSWNADTHSWCSNDFSSNKQKVSSIEDHLTDVLNHNFLNYLRALGFSLFLNPFFHSKIQSYDIHKIPPRDFKLYFTLFRFRLLDE